LFWQDIAAVGRIWFRVEEIGCRVVQRFRGGLVFKAHRLLYHSTLGLRVIKKKRRRCRVEAAAAEVFASIQFLSLYTRNPKT